MREILFRAKRLTDRKWTYGDFTEVDGDCPRILSNENATMYAVAPETIGQYTGLTDKNGKRIFEGDIVCHDFGEKQIGKQYAIVKWSEKYASFQLNPIDDWMFCKLSDVKVVGNIHDNPELIREEV